MSQVKKAVLLSAGFGTRLKPITDNLPKCLVPINGKPLLQIWLEQLSKAGITEFLINSHYLAEHVEKFIADSSYKDLVTIVHEPVLLGTLGTLKATSTFWQDENVLVAHADNLCLCNWSAFNEAFTHRTAGCYATMMLFETDTPRTCGIVELDQQQSIVAFHEKVENPPSNLANAAIYIFDKRLHDILRQLPANASDISLDLIPHLIGRLNGWKTDGYLRDIGNVDSLTQANRDILTLPEYGNI